MEGEVSNQKENPHFFHSHIFLLGIYGVITWLHIWHYPAIGTWNDLSRLAAVESLVEHRTLAIDGSNYLQYTGDKVFVDGHFYSDKPPLLAVVMSWVYFPLYRFCGLSLTENFQICYFVLLIDSYLAAR